MHDDCIACLRRQADKLFQRFNVPDKKARNLMIRLNLFLDRHSNNNLSAPEVTCLFHRLVKKVTNTNDLYRKEKEQYNRILLQHEPEIRSLITRSDNPFQTALRYALAGNIIDFGPPRPFDVNKALSEALNNKPAIDHSAILLNEINKARSILYLGDNAGEIVLDKLFIETINHPNLLFAVRGGNVLNDITLKDAEKTGISKITRIISNGYDAPSTLLERCSPQFRKTFHEADIIISKGQGNLEGLINHSEKKIFFLLMIKCQVMAKITGVKEGDVVIYYNGFKKRTLQE